MRCSRRESKIGADAVASFNGNRQGVPDGVDGDETSGYLIERALDQMRADAWPHAIDVATPAH
jgi:hypothetical protein